MVQLEYPPQTKGRATCNDCNWKYPKSAKGIVADEARKHCNVTGHAVTVTKEVCYIVKLKK